MSWPPIPLLSIVALAQHYGIPTRLLDWTWKSTVAAYFAARGVLPTKDAESGSLAVWALNTGFVESIARENKNSVALVTAPQASNPNLAAQAGLFTVDRQPYPLPLEERLVQLAKSTRFGECVLRKVTLPRGLAGGLLRWLGLNGVTAASIFPSYDGVARAIEEMWFWDPLPYHLYLRVTPLDERDSASSSECSQPGADVEAEPCTTTDSETTEGHVFNRPSDLSIQEANELLVELSAADALEPTPLPDFVAVGPDQRGIVLRLSASAVFGSGQTQVLSAANKSLERICALLKRLPSERIITVEGHTDSVGTDVANRQLSQDRADAIRTFLVNLGMQSDRVLAVGKGRLSPIADNNTPEGRAVNRRIEIIVR